MSSTVYQQQDAHVRLAELGLTYPVLRDAILVGELARSSCTSNDPPALAGFLGWGRTTRGLREATIPLGWKPSEDGQLSTTVHPAGAIAIAVATGDHGTGIAIATPKTKYPKGPATAAAVERNLQQLGLFDTKVELAEERPKPGIVTWLLLMARNAVEIRCELSLPGRIGLDERVEDWAERIILDPISVEPTPDLGKLDEATDFDVSVERRTS